MKPLVYATDCSQNSVAALKMADALSRKLKAKLIVLHVFDVNAALLTSLSITYAKWEKEAVEEHYKTAVDFYKTHIGTAPDPQNVHVVVRENALINEAISNTVVEFKAALLIMGTKGKNIVKDVVIGSTTQAMIKESPCVLLMVPPTVNTYTLENITYATDLEETDITAIDWLVKTLARPYKAHLHVLHVVTNQEEYKENPMPWFKEMLNQKVSYKNLILTSVHSENIFEALAAYPEQEDMDLLVMLKREKQGLLQSLFHTDLVKRMFSQTNIPLLSINKTQLQ